MHLLPCPACDTAVPISPSQAGDQTNCPNCQTEIQIPSLGDLRQLPLTEEALRKSASDSPGDSSVARSIGFGLFAFAAAGCLIVGGYCGIRWFSTDVTMTTDQHIEELRTQYKTLPPARLIREYESMEKYGLELPEPFAYKITENAHDAWRRNTFVAVGISLAFFLIAILLGSTGRQKSRA